MTYRIAVIPGDGVGPEVIREGLKVLDSVAEVYNVKFDFRFYPYGGGYYLKTGEVLPDEALKEIGGMDAIYFGAVGHPEVPPGVLERGLLLKLRFYFDQYVNLRPVTLYPGVETPLKGKGSQDINFYVVRENTEDFYVGLGCRFRSDRYKANLNVKRRLYSLRFNVETLADKPEELAYQIGVITRRGAERVIRYAFDFCRRRGLKRVSSVDKANVLSEIYGLWRDVFNEVSKDYPEIETEFTFVDAMAMWFVKNPERFQVVVAPNMFGDILTDLGAIIQGGMGLAPSGNINPEGVSMFEPIHGSAPKYAGKGLANPIAAILAGKLMLEHFGENEAAQAIDNAVKKVLVEGKVRPRDLGGKASTSEVGDAVAEKISKQ
ncbi:MAG: 3-isopropylmalate dehydrogenase [Candidatus Hecatellales archaeon]|nr:MAG: 3-isopropylmalate dehydrogenase [Candidatus Hecatellales archaeon]